MDKETKDAWTKGKNLSHEALEKRKEINKKILKFFIFPVIIILVVIGFISIMATEDTPKKNSSEDIYSKEKGNLVHSFCYALQASSLCENLQMRIDTEEKIEKRVGEKFRASKTTIYSDDCLTGLTKANEDENKGLCNITWEKYGCSGTENPRLIQENPFKIKNGIFCNY